MRLSGLKEARRDCGSDRGAGGAAAVWDEVRSGAEAVLAEGSSGLAILRCRGRICSRCGRQQRSSDGLRIDGKRRRGLQRNLSRGPRRHPRRWNSHCGRVRRGWLPGLALGSNWRSRIDGRHQVGTRPQKRIGHRGRTAGSLASLSRHGSQCGQPTRNRGRSDRGRSSSRSGRAGSNGRSGRGGSNGRSQRGRCSARSYLALERRRPAAPAARGSSTGGSAWSGDVSAKNRGGSRCFAWRWTYLKVRYRGLLCRHRL